MLSIHVLYRALAAALLGCLLSGSWREQQQTARTSLLGRALPQTGLTLTPVRLR
jgi:hypothetical protein